MTQNENTFLNRNWIVTAWSRVFRPQFTVCAIETLLKVRTHLCREWCTACYAIRDFQVFNTICGASYLEGLCPVSKHPIFGSAFLLFSFHPLYITFHSFFLFFILPFHPTSLADSCMLYNPFLCQDGSQSTIVWRSCGDHVRTVWHHNMFLVHLLFYWLWPRLSLKTSLYARSSSWTRRGAIALSLPPPPVL